MSLMLFPYVSVPISDVEGVLMKKVLLPCDISTKGENDAVYMVLWFKESGGEPIYSFDVRGRSFGQAKLWSSENAFGKRAYFRTATKPAQLLVDELHLEDEGLYRCRVDFRNSPTRNSKINLTVIVPPDHPTIFDKERRDRTKTKIPWNEGSDVVLSCEVPGGRPRPKVIWFMENTVYDESFEYVGENLTVNRMRLPAVGRQHLEKRLVCQASNTQLMTPQFKVVVLDINLKPVDVTILNKEKQISADKKYEVECKATGSRPEATITWYKGSRQVHKIAKTVNRHSDDEHQISMLSFIPLIDDDGKYLTCRAENTAIADAAIEDKWRLNVHYMPVVTLKMGSSLNPDDIKEGDDVYFECNIRANPKAYKLAWFHNGQELHHNVTSGVILSDHSLVLQGVTRQTAGDFTCLAANTEGKGTSNPVALKVMFVPTCKEEREELYGALKHETVHLKCEVDANPPVVTFQWTFNNSGEQTDVPSSRYTSQGTVSRLNYTPVSDMDYGTLSCWGANSVGQMRAPCVYQVVAAGRPFPLLNCTVTNHTSDSLHVECLESFDGGLPQMFLMELLELPERTPRFNVTVTRAPPIFEIYGIESGASYQVNLYALNAKGRSDPVTLETVTFKGVAKYIGPVTTVTITPVLTCLLATAGALLLVTLCVAAALYRRRQARRRPTVKLESLDMDDTLSHGAVLITANNTAPSPADETDPDIIPNKYERRPLKGFMKIYKTPPQRRRKKDGSEEGDFVSETDDVETTLNHLHAAKENIANNTHIVNNCSTLRAHKGVTASSPVGSVPVLTRPNHVHPPTTLGPALNHAHPPTTLGPNHNHKLGPEVVTASHRIQESCI
ncbi:hypothetical protein J6590_024216 [Homalodisca vitripennis]|nr:hypothetical protein J6590_024216 [Homalodisca vitripennis]